MNKKLRGLYRSDCSMIIVVFSKMYSEKKTERKLSTRIQMFELIKSHKLENKIFNKEFVAGVYKS